MKRELRILKRLEYNADDPDLDDRDPEMTGGSGEQDKDLESVLVAKLRRVEAELVKERNQRAEMAKQCEQLRQEVSALETAKADTEKVIVSLEHDLDKAITSSSSSKQQRKNVVPVVSQGNPDTLQSVLDPNAPPPPPGPAPDISSPSLQPSAAEKAADDHSVATIIMAQRDRLRARCEALEAERDSFKRELQAQLDAAESLKADNTKLFEKMRYLQSYSGTSSGRGGAYSRSTSRDLDLEALEQRYEASVDPFRQFGRTERQRKLKEMSPMERTVFVVAKAMLGSKEMRTFLFFYVLAMHLLVFLTTYHWSHSESGCSIAANEHLSHLPPLIDKSPEQVMKDLSGQ
jgi:homeobox protein cut-like